MSTDSPNAADILHPQARLPDRASWKDHPNYRTQGLLLGAHENFRRISRHLVDEAASSFDRDPDAAPRPDLLDLFTRWNSAMRNHEAYEERKLYPYLHAKHGVDCSELEAQHARLGTAENDLHVAYDDNDRRQVADVLRLHDSILVPHLAQEEDMVIPWLLGMSPDDFRSYYHSSIATLLRDIAANRQR